MKVSSSKWTVAAWIVAAVFVVAVWSPAQAHVWKDIYGPGVRDHHHIHLPHFVSPYYRSSRPHDPHHGLPPKTKHEGRCYTWSRRCSINWSIGTADYNGCMKYHGCYYND